MCDTTPQSLYARQNKYIKNLADSLAYKKLTDSLLEYTKSAYAPINGTLFEYGEIADEPYKTISANIDKVFQKIPPTDHELTLYKGIQNQFVPGIYAGYASTTSSLDVVLQFSSWSGEPETPEDSKKPLEQRIVGKYLMEIVVPRGFKVVPLEVIASNKECEILLPKYTKFRVDGISIITINSVEAPVIMVTVVSTTPDEIQRFKESKLVPKKMNVKTEWIFNLVLEATKDIMNALKLPVEDALSIAAGDLEPKFSSGIPEDIKERVKSALTQ